MSPVTVEEAWEVIGVEAGATPDQVAAAYRAKAKQAHPDAGGSDEDWARLSEAYSAILASTEVLHVSAYVDDSPDEHPTAARARRWWRAVPRPPRVLTVTVGGGVIIGVLSWAFISWSVSRGIPWVVPAIVMSYPAMGWLWLIGTEIRRPRIMPLFWVLRQPMTRREWAKGMAATLKKTERPDLD